MASGIVTAQVCSKSGRLPISGVCDEHVTTEYFAEGTVPTEYCDVHYSSNICLYSGLTAWDDCPFKVASAGEQIPARLQDGNLGNTLTTDENTVSDASQMCPHNSVFMSAPNAAEVIQQQNLELQQRAAAEAAASATLPASDTD
jgi:penicillin-binding protein 1A